MAKNLLIVESPAKAKTIEGYDQVLIPGDPERLFEIERMRDGIPLLETVAEDLVKVGQKFNLSL